MVTVIDTRRHNSGETPRGADKEKEDGREREREKGTAYGMV
jgi:hypothetical protein